MDYSDLKKLSNKLFFTVYDVSELLNIKVESARVLCSRYAQKNIFIRLKNNFYIVDQKWEHLSKKDFFQVANFLQVPSYISCMTALSHYEVTTQVQQNFFESASVKRSKQIKAREVVFYFYNLRHHIVWLLYLCRRIWFRFLFSWHNTFSV